MNSGNARQEQGLARSEADCPAAHVPPDWTLPLERRRTMTRSNVRLKRCAVRAPGKTMRPPSCHQVGSGTLGYMRVTCYRVTSR